MLPDLLLCQWVWHLRRRKMQIDRAWYQNMAGNLDVALMPVWGWGPTLGTGHMNPSRAAEALQLLRPRLAIPIHRGTFFPFGLGWLMPRLLIDPPHAFALFAAKMVAGVKTLIVSPGSLIPLEAELQEPKGAPNA